MLPERLKESENIKDFLSMFMKESSGMLERFLTYYSQLKNISDIEDKTYSFIDIFCKQLISEKGYEGIGSDEDYFSTNDIEKYGAEDKMLDLVGSIYGVSREVYVDYDETTANPYISVTIPSTVSSGKGWITLNNYCFLFYIQCVAMKQHFKGTRKSLSETYGFEIPEGSTKYNIVLPYNLKLRYIWNINSIVSAGSCALIADGNALTTYGSSTNTVDIVLMYFSGLLQINSLGINYTYDVDSLYNPYLLLEIDTVYEAPQLHQGTIRDLNPAQGVSFNFSDKIGVLL